MTAPIEPTAVIDPGGSGGGYIPPEPPNSPPDWWRNRGQQQPAGGVIEQHYVHETVYVEHHYVEAAPEAVEPEPESRWFYHRNPRVRFTVHNLSAGMVGYSLLGGLGGTPYGGAAFLAQVAVDPVPVSVALVTGAAALVGWQLGKVFRGVGGCFAALMSPAAAAGCAMWGQGTESLLRPLFADAGQWPGLLAPFVLVTGAGAACWYLIECPVRSRGWVLPARWVARVPLAGVVLSSLLYTSWIAT